MRKLYGLFFALASLLAYNQPVSAGEISCRHWWGQNPNYEKSAHDFWPSGKIPRAENCVAGVLSGEIVGGDYEKVKAFVREHHPFLNAISIQSLGGDVNEAIKIGRLFRRYLIPVTAPSLWDQEVGPVLLGVCQGQDCICASACALIWFGSPERRGRVGLHRHRYPDHSAFKTLLPGEAATLYSMESEHIKTYLTEMEVSSDLIQKFLSTSSGDIAWIEFDDDERPPSYAEWQDANFGYFSVSERNMLSNLEERKYISKNISNEQDMLLGFLEEKKNKRSACQTRLKFNALDALLPPE